MSIGLLGAIMVILVGFASSANAQTLQEPNGPNGCSAKPVDTLTVTLEAEEARFYIRNKADSAILRIRVMNCTGETVEIMARPMVELIRVGLTTETARNKDWYYGRVGRTYSASQRSIKLAAKRTHDFEVDLNKMEFMGVMWAINLWDSFPKVVPNGEFNVKGMVRLVNRDGKGDRVEFQSANHVTVVSGNGSVR